MMRLERTLSTVLPPALLSPPAWHCLNHPHPPHPHTLTAALSQQGGYKGVGDVVLQTMRKEGPLAFWSGISANFMRLGSWNWCALLCFDVKSRMSDWLMIELVSLGSWN